MYKNGGGGVTSQSLTWTDCGLWEDIHNFVFNKSAHSVTKNLNFKFKFKYDSKPSDIHG